MRFPESGYSAQELELLADEWLEDLRDEGVRSAETFVKAVKLVRRRSKFFPKVSEVLECVAEVAESEHQSRLALPCLDDTQGEITPLQVARNRECARLMAMAVSGKISWQEAVARQEKILKQPLETMTK